MIDIIIRPFEDRDYPAAVAVGKAVYPDYPWSEEEWRHEDARYDGKRLILRRIVAELPELPEGSLAGFAEYHHMGSMYHPQKLWTDAGVHPEFQGQGIGTRLYDALMNLTTQIDPIVLWTGVRETFERSIRFVQRRGFQEVRRAWEARLDVASFDSSPFVERTVTALKDLEIVTMAEERERDAHWLQKAYDLHLEVEADVPRPDTYTPQSLDVYVKNLIEHPDYFPEAHFLAKDGNRYIGESFMFRSQQLPDVLYQGLTATRRAYRGRGIARAIKLRTIAYAKSRGIREIRTWNDTLNAPILHINSKLGFVRQPVWITFEKRREE